MESRSYMNVTIYPWSFEVGVTVKLRKTALKLHEFKENQITVGPMLR